MSRPHERLSETSVAVCLEDKAEPSYPSVGLAVEMAGEWAGQPAFPGKVLQLEVEPRETGEKSRACRQSLRPLHLIRLGWTTRRRKTKSQKTRK